MGRERKNLFTGCFRLRVFAPLVGYSVDFYAVWADDAARPSIIQMDILMFEFLSECLCFVDEEWKLL